MPKDSGKCMISEAIRDAIPGCTFPLTDLATMRWTTPNYAQPPLIAFDLGMKEEVVPFVITVRPCQISKSGRKHQYKQPDASQLKGQGIKPTGTGKTSTGGTAEPAVSVQGTPKGGSVNPSSEGTGDTQESAKPAAKPAKRIHRKKLVMDSNGQPTILGGKPPPLGLLRKREFGLRLSAQALDRLHGRDKEAPTSRSEKSE
jgi:hypothetical protein